MKNKYRFLSFLSLCSLSINVLVAADQDAARLLAQQCLNGNVKLVNSKLKSADANPAYYLWQAEGGKGFCLTSAEDEPAVLGYSSDASLSYDNMPEALAVTLANYEKLVKSGAVIEKTAKSVPGSRTLKATSKRTPIDPLLGDIQYDQTYPYNLNCPQDNTTKKTCLTGCVNTAIAQIFKYYEYPKATNQTIPGYTTKTLSISMPSIPKGTTFDWSSIQSRYSTNFISPDETESEISKVMVAIGTAMQSDYTSSSTGTVDKGTLVSVFSNYFGYDKDNLTHLLRSQFVLSAFEDAIYYELQNKRPVYVSGASSGGGHAFVCDGADGYGYFHINWGWSGYHDGYFDMAFLAPYAPNEAGASTTPDGYTGDLKALIGIYPENNVTDKPLPIFNLTNNSIIKSELEVAVFSTTVEGTATINVCDDNDNAYYAIAYKDDKGNFVLVGDKKLCPKTVQETTYSMTYEAPEDLKSWYEMFYLVKSYDNGLTWNIANDTKTGRVEYFFRGEDGMVFAFQETSNKGVILNGDIVCWVENGAKYVQVKLTNTGTEEYYNKIYIYCNDEEVVTPCATVTVGGSTLLTYKYSNSTNKYEYKVITVKDFLGNVIVKKKEVFGEGVENVTANKLTISSLKGALLISSSEDGNLAIYNVTGQLVKSLSVTANQQESVALPKGVYFVNGRKTIVY